jgi:hypothetical protein
MPAPYGPDPGADTLNYVSTAQRDFPEREAFLNYVLPAAQRSRTEEPYGLAHPYPYPFDMGGDALDRFLTSNNSQFSRHSPSQMRDAHFDLQDHKGRPSPISPEHGHNALESYETSYHRDFQPESFDRAQARSPLSGSPQDRPIPWASQPGADLPAKWVSASREQYIQRDIAAAQPGPRVNREQSYDLITLQPRVDHALAPEGLQSQLRLGTAELGLTRPNGVLNIPASRLTEQHFLRFVDTYHANPQLAQTTTSSEQIRQEVQLCASLSAPTAKYRQPITEAQTLGWRWAPGHDGYAMDGPAQVDPEWLSPLKDKYHGRNRAFFTKQRDDYLNRGRSAFSGGLAQNGPVRTII